jgi:hypothetical protein
MSERVAAPASKAELTRYIRARLAGQLYDDSAVTAAGIAIYSLSDPRDLSAVRYIGQTAAPRRRLLQHLSTARLWLPDETPWWIATPQLRPLYAWIRALYSAEGRLPVMVVRTWVAPRDARAAERAQIEAYLARHSELFNCEAQLRPQLPLPFS